MIRNFSIFSLFCCFALNVNAQTEPEKTKTAADDTIGRLPIFTVGEGDLNDDAGTQDVSGLLQSSKDIFTSTAGYNFGSARFLMRGLGSENGTITINGITMNSLEMGWASWSNWGGLNDITRGMEVNIGVSASERTFGGISGSSYLNARASALRKGSRVSYAYSNRSYRHRVMATTSTGVMKNGLSISASASRRYANEGFVEGTFYDAWSYFIALEKKVNEKHSFGIVGFGAPLSRGRSGIAVQEAYDLKDNNFYNPNWGYQNGKKRNSRVSENHTPMMIASHYFKINEKSKLETSLSYSFGTRNSTGLNWFDAKDPRPDYYRYLPGYYKLTNPAEYNRLTDAWTNDENMGQINWDDMYAANAKNLYTVQNSEGIAGNDITANRSKYIVENKLTKQSILGFSTLYLNKLKNGLTFSAGLNYQMHRARNYKTVNDLLGGDFWIDIDNMADRDFNDDYISQNNVEEPNKLIKQGDVYGYDYVLNINKGESFAQIEQKAGKFETFAGVTLSNTSFSRTGNLKNGRFPTESEGKSDVLNFFNYGVKGGVLYKMTGRHFFSINSAYLTRAPLPRNVYLSPQIHNRVVADLSSEKIFSIDVNYIMRFAKWKTRVTLYHSSIKDMKDMFTYYHDEYQTLVNYNLTGMDQTRSGLEFGTEYKVTQTITASGVLALGDHRYANRPMASINRNNSTEVIAEQRTIYLKNYKIGGMPQHAASAGLKYSSPKYWFVGLNFNYFADINLEPNPDRRTEQAVANVVNSDPQWNEILDQTKLDDQFTMGLYGGKSWRIKKYFLSWNVNVDNVLNNRNFATGGFEQLRYDNININKFPPKLGYYYGLTFFTMVSLRF